MSVNKVILIGNVGREPDVRYFEAGKGVANFTLATTERAHKGAGDHIIPERTEWHNIVVRGGLVQIVEKYIHKGSKLYIEGKIRSRTYVDKEGLTHYVTEIVVDVLEILSPRQARDTTTTTYNNTENPNAYGELGEPQNDTDSDIVAENFNTPF